MKETHEELEARIVDEVRRRYQERGYVVEAGPVFEDGSRSDLLAERPDETVLLEVRYVGRRYDDASLESLAEHAARRGWRFTIVLVREEGMADEVEIPNREQVLRLVEDASAVDTSSWIASIAATAAFEAAARYVLSRTASAMPRPSALAYVQALASRGLLSPEEEQVLRRLIEVRNAAAHGAATRVVEDDVTSRGLEIARALVTSLPAAA